MDSEGRITQYVRKVGPGVIHVVSINNWSDMIPDSALSSLDQRLLMMISQTKALNDQMNTAINNKADIKSSWICYGWRQRIDCRSYVYYSSIENRNQSVVLDSRPIG